MKQLEAPERESGSEGRCVLAQVPLCGGRNEEGARAPEPKELLLRW